MLCRTRYKLGTLEYAYNAKRKQYISPTLLSRLNRVKRGNGDKILGVVNVDLYSPDMILFTEKLMLTPA